MQLIVFDIDGTLTETNQVDGLSFLEAWQRAFNIDHLSTVWSDYRQSTDSGIFDEVFTSKMHREALPEDRFRFQTIFVEILERYSQERPDFFREVKGASNLLVNLESRGLALSIATGAWKRSGILKLAASGIGYGEIPIATADDSVARSQIVRTSIERAKEHYGVRHFDLVTYVGDGIWDFRAAQDLGLRFVGRSDRGSLVGKIPPQTPLLTDYSDLESVMQSLIQ